MNNGGHIIVQNQSLNEAREHLVAAHALLTSMATVEQSEEHESAVQREENARLGDLARFMMTERAERRSIFVRPDIIGEPAWDLILALFAACVEQRALSVGEASTAAGTSATTARRFIEFLMNDGFARLVLNHNPEGERLLELTEPGFDRVRDYLRRIAGARSRVPAGSR